MQMAEAAVDSTKFFCHQCSIEIAAVLPDYKCPQCKSGFIEELEQDNSDQGNDQDFRVPPGFLSFQSLIERLRRNDDGPPRRQSGTTYSVSTESDSPPRRRSGTTISLRRQGSRSGSSSSSNGGASSTMTVPEIFIHEFLEGLASGSWSVSSGGSQGQGFPFFFLSPGHHDGEQHELDAIVTLLLNQMDGAGPPPLDQDLIQKIPTVSAGADLESKQCSVCFEYFKEDEKVRRLPCDHHYHEPCIVPWLELHGTCPICRTLISEQMSQQKPEDDDLYAPLD